MLGRVRSCGLPFPMCFLRLFVSVVFMTRLAGRWSVVDALRRARTLPTEACVPYCSRTHAPAPGPVAPPAAPASAKSAPPQARTRGCGAARLRYSAPPADVSQTHPCRFAPRVRPDSVLFSMGKAPSRKFPSRSHLGPSNCSHRGPIGNRPSMENSPKQTMSNG